MTAFISNLKGRFEKLIPKNEPSFKVLDLERERSAIEEFKNIDVPKDPYISPYLASDSALKQLPPVKILVSKGRTTPCRDLHFFSKITFTLFPLNYVLQFFAYYLYQQISFFCSILDSTPGSLFR